VIKKWGTRAQRERLNRILEFVVKAQHFEGIPDDDADWMSDVSAEDLALLSTMDIIEQTDSDGVAHIGKLFFVFEQAKHRRRPIFWPRTLNNKVADVPTPPLPDVVCSALDIQPGSWAATFDLTSSFYQIGLPPAVRRHFAFRTGAKYFRFKRLVMGARWSPEAMQVICEILAEESLKRAGVSATVKSVVHIDNVRFCGARRQHVEAAAAAFRQVCQESNVTLNTEPGNDVHQQGEFLGIAFDYNQASVSLSAKTIAKLKEQRAILQASANPTYAQALTLWGTCSFAARVLRQNMAAQWPVLKFIRRRASAFTLGTIELSSPADIWQCALPAWENWIDELLQNETVRHKWDKRALGHQPRSMVLRWRR
jgi:hypothetical protein